jgi:hypothetical protein
MAPPFDLSWTPELENKLSTQIDGQLPDFIAEDHPQFSQFLKSYYQFLESAELQLTVSIDNIILEVQTPTNLLNEDGTLIVTESGTGSTGKFVDSETITGSTSYATAKVLVEDLGNATPRLFISSQQLFETGEIVTGGTSGASGVITKYRANPVQNIQQLLAYADIDNTIHDFIEEFRKSFMAGIPTNIANGINKRDLEKHIGDLYKKKGTKEGIKLFIKILLGEEATIFYPNQYMTKPSAADWDKPTIIRVSSPNDIDADELIGQSITGESSLATALVENSTTFSLSGGTSYIEFEISSVIGTFENGETAYGISGKGDIRYDFVIDQLLSSTSISNDGILYSADDVLDLDNSVAIGSGDISAVVGTVERGSVSDVIIDSGGTNYEIGEIVVFAENSSEDGVVHEAAGVVTSTNGVIVDEYDDDDIVINKDIIIQEAGTNTFLELFNFQVEVGTLIAEQPYAVFGTDRIYSGAAGYYYPIYLSNSAASKTTILKSSASVNGETFNSTTVTLDGNAGNDIAIGMVVRSNSIAQGIKVTVTSVTDQSTIVLSIPQSLPDNEVLTFDSLAKAVRIYKFLEYPGVNFYSPTATTVSAAASYSTSTYTLYGGNFNYQSDHIYGESGNAASYDYSGGVNTELVLGDRIQSEWAVNTKVLDTNRYPNEGIVLESGDGDITKITVTDPGYGYGLLPSVTVRTGYGNGANVLATTTDIGRISSINITNPGFSYTESPTSEARASFIIKDITGVFAVGDTLTSHTGSIRSYDSTTQVLEVSIEDTIAVQDESNGVTSNEGMRLEDSIVDDDYVDDNLILDADLIYGDTLVDENGDRLLIDNLAATTDFILLEDDEGELIMEHPEQRLSFFDLEDGTPTGDGLGNGFISSETTERTVQESGTTELSVAPRQVKFILESAPTPILTDGGGTFIELDADIEYEENLVINQTNNVATILLEDPDPDIGLILLEDDTPDAGGTEGNDAILLDGTDAGGTDAAEKLLLETARANSEVFYGNDAILLDGTTSSGEDENDKLFLEEGIPGPANIGEKIVFNATDANGTNDPSDLIVLEAGTSDTLGSDIILEDATPGNDDLNSDHIVLDGSGFLTIAGDSLDLEDYTSGDILLEDATPGREAAIDHIVQDTAVNANDSISSEDYTTATNISTAILGGDILLENGGDHIVIEGPPGGIADNVGDNLDLEDFTSVIDASGNSDATDSNNTLLYENDVPFTNLTLDATNATSLDATDKILFEDAGFDFSDGTTSITTATASATIADADIAKLSFNLGTSTEKFGKFNGISHLISEELIRIQDSYYYQDFSYEVQTNSSGDIYLNELKKAVHPSGFNVFAKVLSVSFVSAKAKVAAKPSEEGTIVFRFNNVIHKFSDVTNTDDYYSYTWDAPRVRDSSYT